MLEGDPAPMTTNETEAETVVLGREMGGDEGKDIQRDAVDGNEGVPPLADGDQRGRDVLVELRKGIKGEAIDQVSALLPRE